MSKVEVVRHTTRSTLMTSPYFTFCDRSRGALGTPRRSPPDFYRRKIEKVIDARDGGSEPPSESSKRLPKNRPRKLPIFFPHNA
jgi:hypothetical protein